MPVTPAGPVAVPIAALAEALAANSAVQAWLGVADAAEAAEQIIRGERDTERGDTLPTRPYLGLITDPGSVQLEQVGTYTWYPGGRILIRIYDEVPDEYHQDPDQAEMYALSRVGELAGIVADLNGASTTYGVWVTSGPIPVPTEVSLPEAAERGSVRFPHYAAMLAIGYGANSSGGG